jgi:hypothetical protein
VNRKKASDATVDISEIRKGDPVKIFNIQVAALSWATTQVPEITAAIQSLLNVGFRSAAQVEFFVMIGDEGLHPLQRRWGSRVSGILFLKVLSAVIVPRGFDS